MQVPLRVLQQVVIGGREGALVSVQGEGLFPDVACLQREPHVQVFMLVEDGHFTPVNIVAQLHSMHVLPTLTS